MSSVNLEKCTVLAHDPDKIVLRDDCNHIITIYQNGKIETIDVPKMSQSSMVQIAGNQYRVYTSSGDFTDITVHQNQKVVKTIKVRPKSFMMDIPSNKRAMKELSCNTFVLYQHFIQNVPGFIEALSAQAITESTKLSAKKYRTAIDELIEKGYLVKQADYNGIEFYNFYESPNLSMSEPKTE